MTTEPKNCKCTCHTPVTPPEPQCPPHKWHVGWYSMVSGKRVEQTEFCTYCGKRQDAPYNAPEDNSSLKVSGLSSGERLRY